MIFENLIISNRGPVRVITINRPKVLNALNKRTLLEVQKAVQDAGDDPKILAAIITGTGEKSFVAGADIAEMKNMNPIEAEQFSALGNRVFSLIEKVGLPVIAAVNGYALGGGLELALACDFIYASENARFGLVETKLGLIPGFGGISRLVRRVGVGQARELMFTASQIDAKQAFHIGLVNKIATGEEVIEAAAATAKIMAACGPYAVRMVKGLIREGQDCDSRTASVLAEKGFGLVFASRDHVEGINAFIDKREPSFEGN